MLFGDLGSREDHQEVTKIHFGVSVFVGPQPIASGGRRLTVFAEPLQKALEAVPPRSRGPVRKVIPFLGFGFPVREVVAFGGISRVVNIACGVRKIVALGDF